MHLLARSGSPWDRQRDRPLCPIGVTGLPFGIEQRNRRGLCSVLGLPCRTAKLIGAVVGAGWDGLTHDKLHRLLV